MASTTGRPAPERGGSRITGAEPNRERSAADASAASRDTYFSTRSVTADAPSHSARFSAAWAGACSSPPTDAVGRLLVALAGGDPQRAAEPIPKGRRQKAHSPVQVKVGRPWVEERLIDRRL